MRVYAFFISIVLMLMQMTFSIDPYHVLELQQGATEQQIRQQYKVLRKNAKGNDIKLQLYKDAYRQIMIDSTLQMTIPKQVNKPKQKQNRRNRRRRRGLPRFSDMFRHDYFSTQKQKVPQKSAFEIQDEKNFINQQKIEAQYRLPGEFDDPSYYETQQKVSQTIKDDNVEFNIKAARFILFIGGILLKLTPCFCLYMIFKYRKQNPREQENSDNPFTKAINGWSGRGRRIGGGKKIK